MTNLENVKNITPFIFTIKHLKDEILPKMEVGQALLAERELAEKIGVSRTVLREAKAALWALDLISIEQGKQSVKL